MFTCPICGRAPRSLICNATVITFLVQFYRGTPLTTQAAPLSDAIGMRAHKRAHKRVDRCWCPEKKGSAAVRGFSSALRGDGRDVYGQSVPSWVAAADSAKQHSSPAALGALNESVPEADRSASLTVVFMRVVSGAANAVGGAQAPRLAVAWSIAWPAQHRRMRICRACTPRPPVRARMWSRASSTTSRIQSHRRWAPMRRWWRTARLSCWRRLLCFNGMHHSLRPMPCGLLPRCCASCASWRSCAGRGLMAGRVSACLARHQQRQMSACAQHTGAGFGFVRPRYESGMDKRSGLAGVDPARTTSARGAHGLAGSSPCFVSMGCAMHPLCCRARKGGMRCTAGWCRT